MWHVDIEKRQTCTRLITLLANRLRETYKYTRALQKWRNRGVLMSFKAVPTCRSVCSRSRNPNTLAAKGHWLSAAADVLLNRRPNSLRARQIVVGAHATRHMQRAPVLTWCAPHQHTSSGIECGTKIPANGRKSRMEVSVARSAEPILTLGHLACAAWLCLLLQRHYSDHSHRQSRAADYIAAESCKLYYLSALPDDTEEHHVAHLSLLLQAWVMIALKHVQSTDMDKQHTRSGRAHDRASHKL